MKKYINYNYGVSLIVLVITVIVMTILASSVILSITKTKMIQNTEDAKFKYEVEEMKERYESIYHDLMYDYGGDKSLLKDSDFINKGIITGTYSNRFRVTREGIVYFGHNEREIKILEKMDVLIQE